MLIGDKLHEIRKSKKMTLTELSQKSGVQLATLSRIENKKMTGTIESHMAIAKALGIEVLELYKSVIHEQKQVEITESPSEVFTHNDKSSFEILTKNVLSKQMMPTLIKIESGGATQEEQNAPNSEKFLFVLEGHVEALINNKTFHLEKNTSLYFEASLPHKYKNQGKGIAKILCITTPVSL